MIVTERFKRLGVGTDTALATAMQVVAALLAFIVQMQVVRSLSQENVGSYYLTVTLMAIAVSIADFGIIAAVFPRLSIARGLDTPALKAATVLRLTTFVLGLVAINTYMLLRNARELMLPVTIGYLAVVFSARLTGIRQIVDLLWRLQGRTYITGIVTAFEIATQLALITLLHYLGKISVVMIMAIIAVSGIPGFFLMLVPLWKKVDIPGQFRRRLPMRYYRAIVIAALPIAMMVLFGQLSSQLEMLVVESFGTRSDVAAYGVATRPLTSAVFIATAISFGMAPIVTQTFRSMRIDVTLEFIISVSVRIICVVSIALCVLCNLFAEPILHIFGPQYVQHAYILKLYTVISGGIFLVIFLDQVLLATGRRNQTLFGSLLYFGMAVLLEYALIGRYGIQGMMTAKMIAIAGLIGFQLYCLGVRVRRGVFQGLLRMLLPLVAVGAALLITEGQENLGSLKFRLPVVLAATALSLIGVRAITKTDLMTLRKIRVS